MIPVDLPKERVMNRELATVLGIALALVSLTVGYAAGHADTRRQHDEAVLSGTVVIQSGPLEAVFDCREITGT